MAHDEKADEGLEAMRKQMNYPLIKVCAQQTRDPAPALAPTHSASSAWQNCDMNEEMRQDCVELVVTAAERFQHNFEARAPVVIRRPPASRTARRASGRPRRRVAPAVPARAAPDGAPCGAQSAARLVKETMDKKYNTSWVVIMGEGFGFEARARRPRAPRDPRHPPLAPPLRAPSSRLRVPASNARCAAQVTHEIKHVLWMYFNNCAILVYKGAPAACRFRATPTLRASACAPHVLLSVHRLLRSPSPACRVCAAGARQVGA